MVVGCSRQEEVFRLCDSTVLDELAKFARQEATEESGNSETRGALGAGTRGDPWDQRGELFGSRKQAPVIITVFSPAAVLQQGNQQKSGKHWDLLGSSGQTMLDDDEESSKILKYETPNRPNL